VVSVIVPVAAKPHHRVHLDPILAELPAGSWAEQQRSADDIALCPSYGDLKRARRTFRRFILAQHGAGQSYGGDPASADHPSYPGGQDNGDVGLFLVPNEHAGDRWKNRYPWADVAIVGDPRLDSLPHREHANGRTVVAVSFHWEAYFVPEAGSALAHFWDDVIELRQFFDVIGHGHPQRKDLRRRFEGIGIEYVDSFDDVCRRADIYVCDNSSTIFEFASTKRPVVLMNPPSYRRTVEHGLRFWDAAVIGMSAEPGELVDSVTGALLAVGNPSMEYMREKALSAVYAVRTGSGKIAADVIVKWIEAA
jgi:hypothetical protein